MNPRPPHEQYITRYTILEEALSQLNDKESLIALCEAEKNSDIQALLEEAVPGIDVSYVDSIQNYAFAKAMQMEFLIHLPSSSADNVRMYEKASTFDGFGNLIGEIHRDGESISYTDRKSGETFEETMPEISTERSDSWRLFVDMDGTLNVFATDLSGPEELYEPGYFLNRPPQESVIAAVNELIEKYPSRIYILSAVLPDSSTALSEKNEYLDKYLPNLPRHQRVFTLCGQRKGDAIASLSQNDFLLDDYTKNLNEWKKDGGTGIKLLTDINHTKGSWKGTRIRYDKNPKELAADIVSIVEGKELRMDKKPPRRS